MKPKDKKEKEDNKEKENLIYDNINSSRDPIQVIGEIYNKKEDLCFKVIVVGNSNVGKSCLSVKGIKGVFEEQLITLGGYENFSFYIRINNKIIKLQIWDTCGQERFRSLIAQFFRKVSLAILVYAINDRESFNDLNIWIRQLRNYSSPDCRVFLIGNKADLENERVVKKEEGENKSTLNNFELFMETSAKTGLNAQELFINAGKLLYMDNLKYQNMEIEEKRKDVNLNENNLSEYSEDFFNNNEGCC